MYVVTDFFDLLVPTDECLGVETKWKTELGGLSVSAEKMKACPIDICDVNLGIQATFESHHPTFDSW